MMAVGAYIGAVFNGIADKNDEVDQLCLSGEGTYQLTFTERDIHYQQLFHDIKEIREHNLTKEKLKMSWESIRQQHEQDWLAALEILELACEDPDHLNLEIEIRKYLKKQKKAFPEYVKLIDDGVRFINSRLAFI